MPPVTGPIDVALSLFSGRCTELAPTDLPEGVSPDNQDVAFLPGSVQSRPGASRVFVNAIPGNPAIVYMKTFTPPNGNPLNLYLDSNGGFWREDLVNAAGVLVKVIQLSPGSFCKSVTHNGREFLAFSDGEHGTDFPRQYDGVNFNRVSQDGSGSAVGAADSATAGSIPAGVHQVVVMFLTDSGYITAPSPPVSYTALGGRKVAITNLPIGPANVVARILAFTGAGGANFFAILDNANIGGTPTAATVVFDNTSTTATLDFTDNALFGATAIDIAGNNLFNLVVLTSCLGFESYSGRLFAWGEWNKVQNFLNMGFDGGYNVITTPTGWTVDTAGGTLDATIGFGFSWKITGDGTANPKGRITQGAYQNFLLNQILEGNTQYSLRCVVVPGVANQAGNVIADFYSPSQGVLATATINLPPIGLPAHGIGTFLKVNFNAVTPAAIPADCVLRVYATGLANGATVNIDDVMIIFSNDPYRDNDLRVSYVGNPESFDGVTGDLGPASDSSPIRDTAIVEQTLYLLTGERLHQTRDNGTGEPASWDVDQIAEKCGGVSAHSVAKAKKFFFWVSQEESELSLQIFGGGDPIKISQEIQPDFSTINQDAMSTIWTAHDAGAKRLYIGVPTGNSATPNVILVNDYRELETASDIATYGPIHIGYTGKMIASDRVRKWTIWNLAASSGAVLSRTRKRKKFCIGSGLKANGSSYGNAYSFDSAKLTDDDYGQIVPYWVSYFFVNHEMEAALPVGVHRKLYDMFAMFITGVGYLQVTPLINRVDNPGKLTTRVPVPLANSIQLQQSLKNDIEIPGEVSAERLAVKISVAPITNPQAAGYTNGTDVQFNLQHFSLRMQAHPVSPRRGSI